MTIGQTKTTSFMMNFYVSSAVFFVDFVTVATNSDADTRDISSSEASSLMEASVLKEEVD